MAFSEIFKKFFSEPSENQSPLWAARAAIIPLPSPALTFLYKKPIDPRFRAKYFQNTERALSPLEKRIGASNRGRREP